jgi:hypothetical protein
VNQTRLGSLIETATNTLIGFCVSFVAWPPAAWFFDIPFDRAQHFGIILFFTVLSITRGFVVRRWFNARLHRASMAIAAKVVK